jgi:hypothetical protein
MSHAICALLLTLLMAIPSFAAEVAVNVDCAGKGAAILPTYLGGHLIPSTPPLEVKSLIDRRFPSHGLTDGAMIRVFLIPGFWLGSEKQTWWSHIQSSDQERGSEAGSAYRYGTHDVWELLNIVERLRCTPLLHTQGFPMHSKEVSMALVAFCNGDPSDKRPIGVDSNGFDWKTVGHWASIRASGDARHPPHPEPYRVRYWELGNELYNPGVGWVPDWLKVTDNDNARRAHYYLEGRELNGKTHEGFLAYHKAMRWVDPSIEVGAILGMEGLAKIYTDWNQVVVDSTKGLPGVCYTFHSYTWGGKDDVGIMAEPQRARLKMIQGIKRRLAAAGVGGATLIDSEWHPYEPIKIGSAQMVAALAIADELGVLIENEVQGQCFYGPYDTKHGDDGGWLTMARSYETKEWNLPAGYRFPAYYSFTMFTGATGHALPVTCAADRATDLAAYAMQRKDGVQVVVINKQGTERDIRLTLANLAGAPATAEVDEVHPTKDNLNSEDVVFNNIDMSTEAAQKIDDLLSVTPAATPKITEGQVTYQVKPYSITRIRVQTEGGQSTAR